MTEASISIVTPVFNEEDIIAASVQQNINLLRKYHLDYEIIIVNDGSEDRSLEIISNSFGQMENVIIYHEQVNKGFGAAVRRGISLCKKEKILCVPVDSPLTEDVLEAFLNNLNKADILVSYRIKRLGYSWWMLFNSYMYQKFISLLFGMQLKDYNWMHLYSKKIFEEGKINIEYDGIFMLAEVLIKADRIGYTFAEFPVHQKQRITGVASVSKLSNILKTLKDVVEFRLRLFKERRN